MGWQASALALVHVWPQGKEVIFWETATQLSGHKRHAVLEAVPVGGKEFDKAPGFFKKAMQVRALP